jgi:hypothetical protein
LGHFQSHCETKLKFEGLERCEDQSEEIPLSNVRIKVVGAKKERTGENCDMTEGWRIVVSEGIEKTIKEKYL